MRVLLALLSWICLVSLALGQMGGKTESGPGSGPPVLSAFSAGTPGSSTATITWTSDVLSTSQVCYSLDPDSNHETCSTENSTPVTSHSVSLSGLASSQEYHYDARSFSGVGTLAISSDQTFTTASSIVAGVPGPSSALFAAPYYTCSTNRYIATSANGGSDSNDGTTATTGGGHGPWLTLAHADSASPSAGYCINVQPGTYADGLTITHGGSSAAATGYVVYRCTTLDGCTITDPGNFNNAAFDVQANYVQIDGFTMAASPANCDYCQGVEVYLGNNTNFTLAQHHVWVINSIISGYGQSGVQLNQGEYFYVVHDTFYNNSESCTDAQGSGISLASEVPITSYSPTADDQNNVVTGDTGTLFTQFIMWNRLYNNRVTCGSGVATDGNGIILDTFDWDCNPTNPPTGCYVSGATPFVHGSLVAFNVTYNDGGVGIHIFASEYVTVANNSAYNDALDTNNTGGDHAAIDTNDSYGSTVINNAVYIPCALSSQSGIGAYALGGYTPTTTIASTMTSSQTSVTLSSAANGINGSTGFTGNGSYSLPGGNIIAIGSEEMLVTAGWGTVSLTVQRGYQGTTAATHSSGATVAIVPNYYSHNVTYATGACSDVDGPNNGNLYPGSPENKMETNPEFTAVGNISVGSMSTPPNGVNFALQSGSPAIGYGLTSSPFTFLPSTAADVGACASSLTTCP